MGVHNTAQSFGMFLGATTGGYLSHTIGYSAVFIFCAVLMAIWLGLAFGMNTPPSVKTKMYHIENVSQQAAQDLATKIAKITGVREAVAIAAENTLIVKINNQQSKVSLANIEQDIIKLIG